MYTPSSARPHPERGLSKFANQVDVHAHRELPRNLVPARQGDRGPVFDRDRRDRIRKHHGVPSGVARTATLARTAASSTAIDCHPRALSTRRARTKRLNLLSLSLYRPRSCLFIPFAGDE